MARGILSPQRMMRGALVRLEPIMEVKDSNGNLLADGDFVQVIKDLKVKGLVLKTCFVKKV